MNTTWSGWAFDPIDYEMIRIGSSPRGVGRFSDVHHVQAPVWRLVSGYLSLHAAEDGTSLAVLSHGHDVCRIQPGASGRGVSLVFDDAVAAVAGGVAAAGGVAVVPDPSTSSAIAGRTVELTADGDWGAVLVHGPAPEKIVDRIALLRSLERVGGRRG